MAGERKGQERQLLEVFTKCVHFCWQSEAGNVNWGQREVSVFTGPASSSAAVICNFFFFKDSVKVKYAATTLELSLNIIHLKNYLIRPQFK